MSQDLFHAATRAAYLQSEVDWQDRHIASAARILDNPASSDESLAWAREFTTNCEQYRTRCQQQLDELTAATRPTEA